MAYVQIEADEVSVDSPFAQSRSDFGQQRIEEGPDRLQFHCTRRFLPYPWSLFMSLQLTWTLGTTQPRPEGEAAQVWRLERFDAMLWGTDFA
jgi:hypothetical protein